jgi:uncharacterized membrane protein (UPF0127 family)
MFGSPPRAVSKYLLVSAIIVLAAALVVGAGTLVFLLNKSNNCLSFTEKEITVGSTRFQVALADTAAEQIQGLGGCTAVPVGQGIYFPFNPPAVTSFWMKGMVIPIDIIWIAGGRVVGIEANVPPPSGGEDERSLPRYAPPQPVDGVLEITAGQAAAQGIVVGSTVVTSPLD